MKKSNPQEEESVLPIEKQKIKGKFKHVILTIPALDERWVSGRSFGYYIFPPTKLKNGKYTPGAKEEWLGMMSFVLDDIWWLCELPYHKFWCQVVFDKEAMSGIRSFLHLAPLQKLYFRIEDNELLTMYKRIKKAVFQFLKRLTRTKESTLHFMGEEKYEEIMTTNNLISISLIFCICTVYGKTEETEKMIQYVFKYNKNLRLDEAVLRTTQLFSWLKKKLRNGYRDMRKSIEYCECDELDEIFNAYRKCIVTAIQCLTNAALSVSNFISVCNGGCDVFSNYDFEYHIVRTYKKLLIPLHEEVNLLFGDSCFQEVQTRLVSMLNITRGEFLKTFYACLQGALDKLSNNRESFDIIHNYVKIMKFSSKVEEFAFDFNDTYSIEEITKAIKKCNSSFDLTEVDRVKEFMTESYEKMRNANLADDPPRLNGTVKENDGSFEFEFSTLKLDDPKEINKFVENYCIDFELGNQEDRNSECESVDSNNSKEISDDDASSEYSDWTKNDNSDSEYDCYLTNDESESTEVSASRRQSRDSLDTMSADGRSGKSHFSEYRNDQPGPSGINTRNLTAKARCRPEMEVAITQVKDVLPHLGDGFVVMCLEYYKLDASAVINAILENNLAPWLKSIDENLPFNGTELSKVSGYNAQSTSTDKKYENLKELRKPEYSSYTEMLNDKSEIENFKEIYEKYQIVSHNLYDDDVDEDFEEVVIAGIEADPESLYDNLNRLNNHFVREEVEYEDPNDSRPPKNPLDFCENPEDIRARAEHKRRTKDEKRNRNPHQNPAPPGNESDRTDRERHLKNFYKARSANHNRRYLSDKKRKF